MTIAFHPAGRLALAAASAAALLSGCGAGPARSMAAVPQSPPPAPVQASSTSPSLSPSLSPDPSPDPSRTPGATDLGACRDGDCEVRVRQGDRIPIDPGFGVDEFTVVAIASDRIRIGFTGTSTVVDGRNITISRTCYNDRCQVRGAVTVSTSRPGRVGDIAVRLARVEGDHAVLVLRPVT